MEAFERSKWLAGEMLASGERLIGSGRELSESINMRFLYNAERRLFSIGFNVSEGRLDRAFYDLLASEARLGSFVAIARGDIPVEHWFAMSRPYGAIGRRRALLSWTGTMFEYLMPLLFQRSYGNSLLDKSTREAVAIQIAYGRKHRVPWGISECAFGDLDLHKTYQYYAFGVPELGLKRGLADKIVVAPYATLLAVSIAPRESVQNLKRLADLGLLSDYGYYEALDYSRQSSREGERGVIVRAYMAHHQGMSFLALANFLHDNTLQRHFHADPRVRTVEPLLHERIPNLPPLHHISTRERVSSVASVGEVAPSVSQFETPHTTHAQDPAAEQWPLRPHADERRRRLQPLGRLSRSRAGDRIGPGIRGEPSATSAMSIRTGCGAIPISRPAERLRTISPTSRSTAPCSGASIMGSRVKPRSSSRRKMTLRFGG